MILRYLKIQRLLIAGLVLAIGLAAIRFLSLQGLMIPVRVTSGSMVPWLKGERFRVKCGDCAFAFDVGFESQPRDDRAVCPNCGYAGNRLRDAERLRGQRVLIDRGAYWLDPVQRFHVIAWDDQKNRRLVVKRVIGLPGETIAIRGGEIFVDGELIRKSFDQFRLTAVVVHDNRFLPQKAGIPVRWRPEGSRSGWKTDQSRLHFKPLPPGTTEPDDEDTTPRIDWLAYHHWRCYASSYPRTAEAPVSDNYGYNQGESRALAEVTDLVVQCRLATSEDGWFAVRVHDGRDWLVVEVDLSKRAAVITRDSRELASVSLPADLDATAFEFEFGVLDRQVLLAVNGQELIRKDYDFAEGERNPVSQPVAIGGQRVPVAVEEMLIRRDVYYLGPGNLDETWTIDKPIPRRRLFFLGDNPPLSEDSRLWGSEGIEMEMLHGKVLPLPW